MSSMRAASLTGRIISCKLNNEMAGAGSGRFNFDDNVPHSAWVKIDVAFAVCWQCRFLPTRCEGGSYCGGWYAGMAQGFAVCSGPNGQGVFAGLWSHGFEESGVYTWPTGNTYEGRWRNGKREGVGVEHCHESVYRGEWAGGCKGRHGLRQMLHSSANYQGTWTHGLYDGYGIETYGDGGKYEGQWQQGMRHGFGVRTSAPYAEAVKYRQRSQTKPSTEHADIRNSIRQTNGKGNVGIETSKRSGFALRDRKCVTARALQRSLPDLSDISSKHSFMPLRRSRSELRLQRQHSAYEVQQMVSSMIGSIYSSSSSISSVPNEMDEHERTTQLPTILTWSENDDPTMITELQLDADTIECYMGQWRNDERCGFGVCKRSDGLKYEGQWLRNKKHGYGVTTFKDGTTEKGKYKENVLVALERRSTFLFRRRAAKYQQRADTAVYNAHRAARIARQKCDFVASRVVTARARAEEADAAAEQAIHDSIIARTTASEIDAELMSSIDDSNTVRRKEYWFGDLDQTESTSIHNEMDIESQHNVITSGKRTPKKSCFCFPCGCNCIRLPALIIKATINKLKIMLLKM